MRLTRGSSALVVALVSALATTGAAHSSISSKVTTTTTTTTAPSTPPGLPLYQFTKTGSGPLAWSPTSLSSLVAGATMIAGPRSAAGPAGSSVVAFETASHAVAFLTLGVSPPIYTNLTSQLALSPASNSPVPFFDALGRLNLIYVSSAGHVILATNDTTSALPALSAPVQFLHQPWTVNDLTVATVSSSWPSGVLAVGQLDVTTKIGADLVALRTTTNSLVQLTVSSQRPFGVSDLSTVAINIGSNPVYAGPNLDGVVSVAVTDSSGNVDLYRRASSGNWNTTTITTGLNSAPISGNLVAAAASPNIYLAGVAKSTGALELATGVFGPKGIVWTNANLTALTSANLTPGPALSGELAITVVNATVTIAGRAAGWGDLFDYASTATATAGVWVATDISLPGGSSAKTVGPQVAAIAPAGALSFFAGAVTTPAPRGVGVYAIPFGDLSHAVTDGWRVIGITGGLGTQSAPWVQIPTAPANSGDYLVGQSIQNSHVRATWLSFWTVSGPSQSEVVSPATFHQHGVAAGAAIAHAIDSYRASGVGLKPDWVIFDPEGYPDNHSSLDGIDVASIVGSGTKVTVTTISPTILTSGTTVSLVQTGVGALAITGVITVVSAKKFTIASAARGTSTNGKVLNTALFRADWSAMLSGWQQGLTSVDSSLNAAVYADEYEYASANLASQSMPVFLAIAWGLGANAPVPITHSSNVLGFVEFGNICKSGTVQSQIQMLKSPPWNGIYNTLQFTPAYNAGYCTPLTP